MLIGISGKISHGKDRVGDCIEYLTSPASKIGIPLEWYRKSKFLKFIFPSKFENRKFAAKLKYICHILSGLPLEDMYSEEGKRIWLPYWNMTVRELQIKVGTPGMRDGVHKNGWIIALFSDYYDKNLKPKNWFITDMRFPNEAEEIESKGGFRVRVNRPGIKNLDHISETALDNYRKWDWIIENDGSLKDLLDKVRVMLLHFEQKTGLEEKITLNAQMIY